MKNKKIKLLCSAGIFAALIFIFTSYFHVPVHTGYVHLGDAFIYLAASVLPLPYAIAAGAVGASAADFASGFALWAPATAIIKALTAACFSSKSPKLLSRRNLTAFVPAFVLCVLGYYLYEALISSNFIAPLAGVLGNVVQVVSSAAIFCFIAFALDKANIKKYL